MRVGSVAPDLVDGIVSSVPAGSRFHAKSEAVKVAVRLLKNKHEQFNIGRHIIKEATDNSVLREDWADDPSFRMKLSAVELRDFQRFMDENVNAAEKIENLPVIIYQGFSDQLVKPLGTLTLYQAIGSKDKDLVIVGHAEHLIFEEAQFDPIVVDGLLSWLKRHAEALQAKTNALQ